MLVFSCATSRELRPKIFTLVKAVYRECAIMHNHTVIVLVFKGSKNACEVIHRRDFAFEGALKPYDDKKTVVLKVTVNEDRFDSDGFLKMLAFKGVAGIQKNFFGEAIPATSLILLETLGVST